MSLLLFTLPHLVSAQPPAPTARRIAAGYQHTLVVKSDGTVWAFGNNTNSELGDNTTTIRRVPQPVAGLNDIVAVAVGTSHSLALSSTGTVYAWGDNLHGQVGDATTTDRRTPVALR